jgi:phosphoenolpyruvate carboxykinase (GTP)
MDFLSIPMGTYVNINIQFGDKLDKPPAVYSVNYFLKDKETGEFLNSKLDKLVWLKWMELRVNGEADAIDIGTGFIPRHEDLAMLFDKYLDREYTLEDYIQQFTLRVDENIAKIDRIMDIYKDAGPEVPAKLFQIMESQKKKLEEIREGKGDYISPLDF